MKRTKKGDLIRFSTPRRGTHPSAPQNWIDENNNIIPYETLGVIVSKQFKKEDSWSGWEYDILIPSLGIVSPNWGNFAFKKLEDTV